MIEYLGFFHKKTECSSGDIRRRVLHTKTVDVCVNAHMTSFKSHQIQTLKLNSEPQTKVIMACTFGRSGRIFFVKTGFEREVCGRWELQRWNQLGTSLLWQWRRLCCKPRSSEHNATTFTFFRSRPAWDYDNYIHWWEHWNTLMWSNCQNLN